MTANGLDAAEREPWPDIDITTAHPARVYDCWLGGKANFAVDRAAAEQSAAANPAVLPGVRANRAFLGRAVRYLVGEAGIRQFLDIGAGIPTQDNVHEVAQRAAPDARIVYVDNDPIVLAHAHHLLTSTPEGACAYIYADLRETGKVLREAAKTLDFGQPVALLLLMILQYVPDADDPHAIVARLVDALPPGSYLAASDVTNEIDAEGVARASGRLNERLSPDTQLTPRSRAELLRFFDGLDLVEPGLVQLPRWRPGPDDEIPSMDIPAYCAVGRKP
ncbi:MAG TPA: SAM-dependent methyltransferase [Streptosporangiaceae bacterium]